MERKSALLLLVLTMSDFGVYAQDNRVLSVCEVLRSRLTHNGKIIAVRGVLHSSPEGTWLSGGRCAGEVRTGDHVWPNAINLSIIEPLVPWPDWPSVRDDVAIKRVQERIRQLKPQSNDNIWITCVGRFETFTDLSAQVYRTPDGKLQVRGLGDQSAFSAQFLTISTRDPEVERRPPTKR